MITVKFAPMDIRCGLILPDQATAQPKPAIGMKKPRFVMTRPLTLPASK